MYIQLEQVHSELAAELWVPAECASEKVPDTSDGVLRAILSRSLALHQASTLIYSLSQTHSRLLCPCASCAAGFATEFVALT